MARVGLFTSLEATRPRMKSTPTPSTANRARPPRIRYWSIGNSSNSPRSLLPITNRASTSAGTSCPGVSGSTRKSAPRPLSSRPYSCCRSRWASPSRMPTTRSSPETALRMREVSSYSSASVRTARGMVSWRSRYWMTMPV